MVLFPIIDSKDRIAKSNIYSIFGKILLQKIRNNDDGEILSKKVGLSNMWNKYGIKLSPYSYYGKYQNDNELYNPEYACLKICEEIEDKEDILLSFFNSILENTHEFEEKIYNKLSNYLGVIGYELQYTVEVDEYYGDKINYYSIVPSTEGVKERNNDIDYLKGMLSSVHPDLASLYDEAINNFGTGAYVSCIENCRSLFEQLFKKLDTDGDYVKGILQATGESVIDNGQELKSIKKYITIG